jgi:hypothetical protein
MIRTAVLVSLVTAALGALSLAIAAVIDPDRAATSYLFALSVALGIAVGAVAWVLIAHVVNARSLAIIQRAGEIVGATLPLLAVLFLPLLFFASSSALAFLILVALSELLLRLRNSRRLRTIALLGAWPFVIASTLAVFDGLKSLDPELVSTMMPIHFFVGALTASLALLAIIFAMRRYSSREASVVGRLLLAMVALWAYIALSQILIFWMGDLPEEAEWLLARMEAPWSGVAIALLVLHVVLPLVLLLPYALKRRPAFLAAIAGSILAAHVLDVAIVMLPSAERSLHWGDAAALFAVLGAATLFALWRGARRSWGALEAV